MDLQDDRIEASTSRIEALLQELIDAVAEAVAEDQPWEPEFERHANTFVDAMVEDVIAPAYLDFAERTFEAGSPSKSIKQRDTFRARLADWLLGSAAERITRINDTTRGWIRETLAALVAPPEGGSTPGIRDIARALREQFSEISHARAERIARTEVISASNAGSMAGAQELIDRFGLRVQKEWISNRDARVRPAHRAVDGQRVAMQATFDVEGFPMLHPGDPAAPAHLVVNCRCVLGYITDE